MKRRAAEHGFAAWPNDEPLDAIRNFQRHHHTPSTALLDSLRAGKLPVLVVTAPLQSDLLYAVYPLRAADADSLVTLSVKSADPQAYTSAWNTIAPGAPPRRHEDLCSIPTTASRREARFSHLLAAMMIGFSNTRQDKAPAIVERAIRARKAE